jgi:subtilisin family serine protease
MKHLKIISKFIFVILLVTQVSSLAFAKIRVAVIDTGADVSKSYFCKTGHKDFTGEGMYDSHPYGHGSIISSIISKYNKGNFCIVMLKAFGKKYSNKAYISALKYAYDNKYDILNLSISGTMKIKSEKYFIFKMLAKSQIVVAAAGNNWINFDYQGCIIYPACLHKNIIVVSSKQSLQFNKGKRIDFYRDAFFTRKDGLKFEGTSFSAPHVVGEIAKRLGEINDRTR